MGFWGTSTTENTDISLQTNDCSQDASTQTTTTQEVNVRMEMDCSFEFTDMNVVAAVCDDGTEMSGSEAMKTFSTFTRDCNQVANLNIQSNKETSSGFTAACLQSNKNKTKQKATSVAGLSFPGTSASATNYKSSASAQRASMVSSFYSMSSQKTSATMLMDAHTKIARSKMDTCSMKVLLDHLGSVSANQALTVEAGISDKVSNAVAMQARQFNSNVTDQTAVAKTDISFMWILILVAIFVVIVMIGPMGARMLFKASKGVFGAVKGGVIGAYSATKTLATSAIGTNKVSPLLAGDKGPPLIVGAPTPSQLVV
jgi:hypothetical protein